MSVDATLHNNSSLTKMLVAVRVRRIIGRDAEQKTRACALNLVRLGQMNSMALGRSTTLNALRSSPLRRMEASLRPEKGLRLRDWIR